MGVSLFWLPVCLTIDAAWRLRARRARYAVLTALGAVSGVGEALWAVLLQRAGGIPAAPFGAQIVGRFDTNLVFFVSIVALVWLRERRFARAELARRTAEMDAAIATEQLHVLALQLHPHFLFNTLNLASQLVYSDPGAARATIANLRTLLLESLEHASSRDIPLREELRFLSSYLAIQRSRFGDRLSVTVDAETATLDAAVPHLLLQPLVENAIAHGIGARDRGGRVDLRTRRNGGRLSLTIEDDGVGPPERIEEGVGLTITRQRLQQLFAGDYSLVLGPSPTGSGTRIDIDMPYRAFEPEKRLMQPAAAPPADLGDVPGPAWWARLPLPIQLTGAWLALALIWLASDAPRMHGASALGWARQIAFAVANAAIWSGLSLVPLVLSRRFDIGDGARLKALAVHLLAACATSVAHLVTWLALLNHFSRVQYEIQLRNRFAWFVWDIAVYTAIVAFATVAALGKRARESALALRRADTDLLRTRLAALRLRLQPSMLVRSLDAVAVAVQGPPERAEHAIARLGDFLRALLATRDHDYSMLDDELELLGAYLDVVAPAPVRIDARGGASLRSALLPATIAPAIVAVLGGVESVEVSGSPRHLRLTFAASTDADPDLHAIRLRLEGCYGNGAGLEINRRVSRLEIQVSVPLHPASGDTVGLTSQELAVA